MIFKVVSLNGSHTKNYWLCSKMYAVPFLPQSHQVAKVHKGWPRCVTSGLCVLVGHPSYTLKHNPVTDNRMIGILGISSYSSYKTAKNAACNALHMERVHPILKVVFIQLPI